MLINIPKLGEKIIMTPLAHLLAWILGGAVQDWDTLDELRDNFIPALIRLPIKALADVLDDIPVIGDILDDFADYLAEARASASGAQVTANRALAVAQGILAGGGSFSETFDGSGALDPAKWTIASSRLQRVSGNLGITTQTGDGIYRDWATYNSQFQGDDQSVAIVLGAFGNVSLATSMFLRCNSDATRFVYLNIFRDKFYLGQGSRSGGTWTSNDWTNDDFKFGAGDSIALVATGDLFTLTINGNQILQYPDTGHTGPKGTSYRRAGVKIEQTRAFFTNARSHHVRAFAISDI